MFVGYYIITKNCKGQEIAPQVGYTGPISKGTPVVCTYFDQHGMEFAMGDDLVEFRLTKPCPILPACSCDICDKIVATKELTNHKQNDINCRRLKEILQGD